jgi:hypothetical protein
MARYGASTSNSKLKRQSVIQFVIDRVLTEARILELENIVFVEELEMPFAPSGDDWVICVEGQLGDDGQGNREEQQDGSRAAVHLKHLHGSRDAVRGENHFSRA